MTIYYNWEIATCTGFGCFLKLLLRWRGSIYKLIWKELLFFMSFYYACCIVYHYLLTGPQQISFAKFVHYCLSYAETIPLLFLLGFFIRPIMSRWWRQYLNIPNPDVTAVYVSAFLYGSDERSRVMRRTIMRYVCLCLTMVFRDISIRVKKRYPTTKHYVSAGLLTENEYEILDMIDLKYPGYSKHFVPIVWACAIAASARKEGRIPDDHSLKTIIDAMNDFRSRCILFLYYDFVPIPLVYVQVVLLAVYVFLICSIFAKQSITQPNDLLDYWNSILPINLIIEYFFYMGWLKVGETLSNPWGEDDEDFEVNWLIDRNLKVSYMIVDDMHNTFPDLVKDLYWDNIIPDTDENAESPPLPSTFYIATDVAPKNLPKEVAPEEEEAEEVLDELSSVSPTKSPTHLDKKVDEKAFSFFEQNHLTDEEEEEDAFEQLRQQRQNERIARRNKMIADSLNNV